MQNTQPAGAGIPQVEARDVAVVYPGGTRALDGLSCAVPEGGFVAIVGPSGCGKSTFLKALAGLVPVAGGDLRVDGGAPGAAHGIAFVFQQPTLLSWRTVAGNAHLPLELARNRDPAHARAVGDVLAWVGLEGFARAYPPELSGGMQMRVSLARALITRPRLLLMDEPFGALDDITRQRLNEDVSRLWTRDRWTALFITHNVAEAVFLAERVLVMSARPGRFLADIPVGLPHPRAAALRTTPEFNARVEQVSRVLAQAGGAA